MFYGRSEAKEFSFETLQLKMNEVVL